SSISVYGPGNTAPQEYGYAIGFGPDEPVGTIFTTPGERIKVAMRSGSIGVRYLLLNSKGADNEEMARGEGFETLVQGAFLRTSYQAANDMWHLNESRIKELKSFSIENQRLDQLHVQAKLHLDLAEQAMQDKRWGDFIKHTRAGMGIESRAYPDVKDTQNDVVRGIIFFMVLVIPCAYFVERLVFTFADIRFQILGFGGVFFVIWMFLSQVHPAFQLSSPIVILLAFVIFALAIFVISIVAGRFNENIRRLRNSEVLLHDTDVGRVSASVAAFQLGIANMKRRKLRTWLTFVTLVLLTFTVLSFTSIKSSLQFHQLPLDTEGQYPGMLIRSKFWGALEESAYDYARVSFGDVGVIAPRSWYITRDKKKTPIETKEKSTKVLGILGVTSAEAQVTQIDTLLSAGRWFKKDELACILPGKMANLLGVTADDVGKKHVRLFGKQLRVIGLIDAEKMRNHPDLDGEILSPADFKLTDDEAISRMSQQESREKQGLEQPEVEVMPFEHLDPDDIAIIPYQILRDVGSPLQSVAIRFHDSSTVEAQVKDYLSRLSVVLFAGIPSADGTLKVSVYSSLGNTSLQGLANLFVPILVAALIVLNTMMGSVYERFREIGIYSSVGLAPVHIAFLFIAEACVYAVLGTVSGYLVGQAVAKILLWQGWLSGFTLNYSALSTVISSVLVMAVVMLSSIYPARQASMMAVPDVTRRWKLPDPDGDHWHFEFPFTVGGNDVFGLSVFLVDYFDSHTGESMGTFFTNGAQLGSVVTEKGQGYTIETSVWLAPYDLGVSQSVCFEAVPLGEHNIFTMALTIDRLSGDAASWRRVNQGFMNALRKQFLIWRTVEPPDRARYTEKGMKMLEEREVETV
ncbi:MAG: ABC transporter permease, partial [Candidatus Latescibacteria bacterium]|nr:ABC transporter permease [Candidatus Latescibacterota bacterium]